MMRPGPRLLVGMSFGLLLLSGLFRPAAAWNRRLGIGLGASLGAFHSCAAFSLDAAFPLTSRLSAEGEFSYYFNPDGEEKDPPPGAHRSSAGLGLTAAGVVSLGKRSGVLTPFGGIGAGYVYLSTLSDRPPEPRAVHSRSRFSLSLLGGLRINLGPRAGLRVEVRRLFLFGGEGNVLRLSAGAFAAF